MEVPEEVLDMGLSPNGLFLLLVLNRARNRWGEINITMEELSKQTGWSRTTLWREVSELEKLHAVDTIRTRRNWGRFYKNRYEILVPGMSNKPVEVAVQLQKEVEVSEEVTEKICFKSETSTASYISYNSSNSYLQVNTTYLLDASRQKSKEETMVNKWQDDGDDLAGYGLFEEDKKPKIGPPSKANQKTRHLRPKAEWTPRDVAAEFSTRLYKHVANIPNLAAGSKLAPILAKYRKQYATTAEIELEIMDMLFNDHRQVTVLKKEPHKAMNYYLRMLTTDFEQAVKNLAMRQPVDKQESAEYVYATDGKRFDNSMFGRRQLEKYEEGLK